MSSTQRLAAPLMFQSGAVMPNRFMLAPLTNLQSHDDGVLSDEEYTWLTMRAEGGFGMTMTCAASVLESGLGFPGQLGVHAERHNDGLKRFADGIKQHNSMAIVQLHHAGMRSMKDIIKQTPLCPSDNEETGAKAMTLDQIHEARDAFITSAQRAQAAGFDGVEIHGAHGYLLGQFISPEINKRDDAYGGDLENRTRLIDEIIDGIRATCRKDFCLGIRLSPERFGIRMDETIAYFDRLAKSGKIDFIDMSLWDINKEPEEEAFKGETLLSLFANLPRYDTRLTVAGKIMNDVDINTCMDAGIDFVALGRAAILHHDLPNQMMQNGTFTPIALPAPRAHLKKEGLGPKFLDYMSTWAGFVADEA